MFCPRCGAENGPEHGYCRKCGLSLPAVGLALEGRVDEAFGKLRSGSGSLSSGAIIFIIGLLNALANGYFAAWQSAVFSLVLGSAIGVPLLIAGMVRVGRAKRLLNPKERIKDLPGAGEPVSELLPGAPTRTLSRGQAVPGSVTEDATLKLESTESAGQK